MPRVPDLPPDAEPTPEPYEDGDLVTRIRGDESRPRRKRYKWEILEWGTDIYGGTGWLPKYHPQDVYSTCNGYAKTLREAELAARREMCYFQLTTPADPTTPNTIWIDA